MRVVFCADPLSPTEVDRSFAAEAEAVEELGIPRFLIDFDLLTREADPAGAVRRVPRQAASILATYRGWMMTVERYRDLFDALASKNVRLINDPDQYRHAHHLPENYPVIEASTPRSIWLTGDLSAERIMEALAPFGDSPMILKDFVKSRKHEWREACFLPSASDRSAVSSVVGRFLELQGDDLVGGLVFREFVEFEPIGIHPRSGMPITEEYRVFWLDARPIDSAPYWPGQAEITSGPPLERFAEIAAAVSSRFFTMDLARRRDGEWMIVELGDGQVSGLSPEGHAGRFYRAMRDHWPSS